MRRDSKYWLMAHVVHVADRPFWEFHSHEWTVHLDSLNESLTEGDLIYLINGELGIFAWGYISEIMPSQSSGQTSIKISRGAIKSVLIDKSRMQEINDLADLLLFRSGKFTFLTNKQVKTLNSLLPHGISKPPMPRNQQFIIDQPVEDREGLHTEFKEINVNKIPDDAYDYAQSFINQNGGSIYFGIRDKDKTVVGINVEYSKTDSIQQRVENKLFSIKPSIKPFEDYSMEFHSVMDPEGNQIPDCYVFELEIKPSASKNYRSAGGKHLIKTFSGKKRLE